MTAETFTARSLKGADTLVPFGYAKGETVLTPNASYTVEELINLIAAAQVRTQNGGVTVVDGTN
ncbi:hypothetical protein STIP28_61 [Synechococcus T7-like virus S-TIP28]|uniref:Uncharacterized protein n=1 Tax=Synechococcus T7-like virus S-TIP28 TaxID=1332140 RepID=A0AAE8XFQ9_9CAUD|nr:hypothetical protein STIP28_61 [Synechococcus T7-like virus S-TIP28]